MSERIELVDLREKYFKVSNRIFDYKLDAYEISIYSLLCRYADNSTTESFPSISTISDTINISKPKVISTIKSLVNKEIIYKKLGDRIHSNKYYLMSLTTKNEEVVKEINHPSKPHLPQVVNEVNTKKTHVKILNEKTKYTYGEEKNVLLTANESNKLIAKHGDRVTAEAIAKLSAYKLSIGKKYKSDYGAINTWVIDAVKKKGGGDDKQKLFKIWDDMVLCIINNTKPEPEVIDMLKKVGGWWRLKTMTTKQLENKKWEFVKNES